MQQAEYRGGRSLNVLGILLMIFDVLVWIAVAAFLADVL